MTRADLETMGFSFSVSQHGYSVFYRDKWIAGFTMSGRPRVSGMAIERNKNKFLGYAKDAAMRHAEMLQQYGK